MKRDNDFLRSLMIGMADEAAPEKHFRFFVDATPEETKEEYHLGLLLDAGYLSLMHEHIERPTGQGGNVYKGRRLRRSVSLRVTNSGHDYVEATRDEGIWAKTKAIVAEEGGNATLSMVNQIAVALLKRKFTDLTGLQL